MYKNKQTVSKQECKPDRKKECKLEKILGLPVIVVHLTVGELVSAIVVGKADDVSGIVVV